MDSFVWFWCEACTRNKEYCGRWAFSVTANRRRFMGGRKQQHRWVSRHLVLVGLLNFQHFLWWSWGTDFWIPGKPGWHWRGGGWQACVGPFWGWVVKEVLKDCAMIGDITMTSLDESEEVLPLQIKSFGVLCAGWNLILSVRQVTRSPLSCGQSLKTIADSTFFTWWVWPLRMRGHTCTSCPVVLVAESNRWYVEVGESL